MFLKVLQLLPVAIFFISYKMTANLILATTLIVASCLITTLLEFFITRKISRMQVILVAALLIFGLPTILLKDPIIIKWKVTVVNMALTLTIFVTQFILKKNPFAYILEKELPLPAAAFGTLGLMWMIFFFFSGLLNVVIAFYLPDLFGVTQECAEELWVDYKTFGNAIINGVFAIISMSVLFFKYPEIAVQLSEKKK